jgi:hypothetical protein
MNDSTKILTEGSNFEILISNAGSIEGLSSIQNEASIYFLHPQMLGFPVLQ